MVSNSTIDIHFLTHNQTIAEIMPRATIPGADPVCAMWCPDKSHAEECMTTIMHSEKSHKRSKEISGLDFCCLSLEPFRRLTLLFIF